jgi:hypothetical protein
MKGNYTSDSKKTIEGLIVKQKPVVEKKEKKNINTKINRIIHYLRIKDKICHMNEISKDIKDLDLKTDKEFLDYLANRSEKLKYDSNTETFSLKSKYGIKNIEGLKDLIRTSENGLVEDEELTDTYPGIKGDLDRIKRENYVKVIVNEEKKVNVLFYRDTADKIEKLLINNEYKDAITELRGIWKDINYYAKDEDNTTFLKKRKRINDEYHRKSEKRQRRNNKRLANVHLQHFFSQNLGNTK